MQQIDATQLGGVPIHGGVADFETRLANAFAQIEVEALPLWRQGKVADYIPELGEIDPNQFGMCITTIDGGMHTFGESAKPFSIQSISKLFTLELLVELLGESVWEHIGRSPTNSAFNSLGWLEQEKGKPYNPFVNAGALAVTDRIMNSTAMALHSILQHIRQLAGDQSIQINDRVGDSERATCWRNLSIAYLMKSFGTVTGPVETLLDVYCDQCAIELTCEQLARAGLLFVRGGIDHFGNQVLTPTSTDRINALLATAGMYDGAGEFAFRVGLPAKSGVGGGILAISPGKMAIAAWGPALDATGQSIVGLKALEILASHLELSVFRHQCGV
ncbi:MAG: glutaminase [Beijerinckiaceae bacterium]|nr:glutaminase [Beijerinckiaceae bacterium]